MHRRDLGTAKSHPWLAAMYRHLGFTEVGEKQLAGKKHVTVYFKKRTVGGLSLLAVFLFVTHCPILLGTIEKTYLPGSRRTKYDQETVYCRCSCRIPFWLWRWGDDGSGF